MDLADARAGGGRGAAVTDELVGQQADPAGDERHAQGEEGQAGGGPGQGSAAFAVGRHRRQDGI
ncbi:MAG: hypothetical protein HS111_01960 [Kofleriaceae bacterium]|nr:hypothetical protein [Kofleriaceae bacterium]